MRKSKKTLTKQATSLMLDQLNTKGYTHWSLFSSMRDYKQNRDTLFEAIVDGVEEAYKCKQTNFSTRQLVSFVYDQFTDGSMSKMHPNLDTIAEKVYSNKLKQI